MYQFSRTVEWKTVDNDTLGTQDMLHAMGSQGPGRGALAAGLVQVKNTGAAGGVEPGLGGLKRRAADSLGACKHHYSAMNTGNAQVQPALKHANPAAEHNTSCKTASLALPFVMRPDTR
ncbi:MAG: hypothetical protein FRX49_09293 [Trebouxia sp. A1-2]|nr:MAG: hypothetical protein FRX49_09293 [Trebouxia sp. A1-2]